MTERPLQNNLLLISGSGRRTGKTTLACALIKYFSESWPVTAVKISPHPNHNAGIAELLAERNGFRLFKETQPNEKDSGLFLAAGAKVSYFLEVTDHNIDNAWEYLMDTYLNMEDPLICESGYLGHLIKPGLMIFTGPSNPMITPTKQRNKALSDLVVVPGSYDIQKLIDSIQYSDSQWILNPE